MAKLHARGQRWVPILDPGIHIRAGYAPYDSGVAQDVFLRDISGGYYIGQAGPCFMGLRSRAGWRWLACILHILLFSFTYSAQPDKSAEQKFCLYCEVALIMPHCYLDNASLFRTFFVTLVQGNQCLIKKTHSCHWSLSKADPHAGLLLEGERSNIADGLVSYFCFHSCLVRS